MKRRLIWLLLLLLLPKTAAALEFKDALSKTVRADSPKRVVSLYGSFAENWLLAGGTLAGATRDAVTERGLTLGEDVLIVGTVKEPNLELLLRANPDFVLLSADIEPQVKLDEALTALSIPHAYFRVDDVRDYAAMMKTLCDLTGRDDLYEQNAAKVERRVRDILDAVPKRPKRPTVLLLRAYSTGIKAKGADNLTGAMLKALQTDNLADTDAALQGDLSLEHILRADPDYIFVTTMGDPASALETLDRTFVGNPAWAGLKAVRADHFYLLDKALFHYMPGARWGESYEILAKILYPDVF